MISSLSSSPHLIIIVALACEAKPIIDHLRLQKLQSSVFPLYINRAGADSEMVTSVVVSGIGALNMAAAVAWIGAQLPVRNTVWLNLGIAGHQLLEVGSCVRVVNCLDQLTGRRFYPPLI